MNKRTKILLSIIAVLVVMIACYTAVSIYQGIDRNKQATAIRYYYPSQQSGGHYTCIIYNGEEYYQLRDYYNDVKKDYKAPSFLPASPYFCEEVSFDEFIYVKESDTTCGAEPLYKLNNDANTDVLFEKNNSAWGPSYGWYYYKKDYVFPTIKNTQVKELLLQRRDVDGSAIVGDYDIVDDRSVIDKVIAAINVKADISQLLSKELYGDWVGLLIRYEDSPLIEDVGGIYEGKFKYLDIDEWMENKRA